MEKEQKIIAKKSFFSKILTISYYFFMSTWFFWLLLYFSVRAQMHNAVNSSYKTTGIVVGIVHERIAFMKILYSIGGINYIEVVEAMQYEGPEVKQDWIGKKFIVSYLPDAPDKDFYVHTDSVITDAFPNKNSTDWERIDSLYHIYQKTR